MIHTKRQMADYTAKAMKQVDLNPGMKTYGMYVTGKKTWPTWTIPTCAGICAPRLAGMCASAPHAQRCARWASS